LVGSDALFLDPATGTPNTNSQNTALAADDATASQDPAAGRDGQSAPQQPAAHQTAGNGESAGADTDTGHTQAAAGSGQTFDGAGNGAGNGEHAAGDTGGTGNAGGASGGGNDVAGGITDGATGLLSGTGGNGDIVSSVVDAVSHTAAGSGGPLNVLGDLGILHGVGGGLNIGLNGLLAPEVGALNSIVDEVHLVMENFGHRLDINGTIHALIDLGTSTGLGHIGDGQHDLVSDVLSLPNDLLHGANPIDSVGQIVADVGTIVGNGHLNDLKDGLLGDLANPLLSLDLAGDNQDSPSHHLIDVDVGKQTNDGLIANILANPDNGPHHQIEANIVKVGANGPTLLDADLLNHSDLLHFPALGGTGADSLVGSVLGVGSTGGGTSGGGTGALTGLPGLDLVGGLLGTSGSSTDNHTVDVSHLVSTPLHHGLGLV